jgi:hypothetical protein
METQEKAQTVKLASPLKSIRRHCLDCASRPKDVRNCTNTACNLYRFRMGRNPSRKGIGPGRIIKGDSKADSGAGRGTLVAGSEQNETREYIGEGGVPKRVISKEIRLIEMEAIGRVQMIDRRIIIELAQD